MPSVPKEPQPRKIVHKQNSGTIGRLTAIPRNGDPESRSALSGPKCVGVSSYRYPVLGSILLCLTAETAGSIPDPCGDPNANTKKYRKFLEYHIDIFAYLSETHEMDVALPLSGRETIRLETTPDCRF